MVRIHNYSNHFFYPENTHGLEEVILFPAGEYKQKGIPSSSVWVYSASKHDYNPKILGLDVGCGIAGFKTPKIDIKESADAIANYVKEKKILGRGNHFIDICSKIFTSHIKMDDDHMIMLIHTDGKKTNKNIPSTYENALIKISDAEKLREELGQNIAKYLDIPITCFGNWTHNSVERIDGKIIYRKGVVKTAPEKFHILPSHLGYGILLYTVHSNQMPPCDSMPHGSGRKGPLSTFKVTEQKAKEVRKYVYVPQIITNPSLKSEHPSCYNNPSEIIKKLNKFIIPLGDTKILAYIGKI